MSMHTALIPDILIGQSGGFPVMRGYDWLIKLEQMHVYHFRSGLTALSTLIRFCSVNVINTNIFTFGLSVSLCVVNEKLRIVL